MEDVVGQIFSHAQFEKYFVCEQIFLTDYMNTLLRYFQTCKVSWTFLVNPGLLSDVITLISKKLP